MVQCISKNFKIEYSNECKLIFYIHISITIWILNDPQFLQQW